MNRTEKLQNLLRENDLDAILLRDDKNRRWHSGVNYDDGTALITRDAAYCYVDSRCYEVMEKNVRHANVVLTSVENPLKKLIRQHLESCGAKRLGFEEDYLCWKDYKLFEEISGCKMVPAAKIMTQLRSAKDESELECIKKAQAITEAVFDEMLNFIKPGMRECEIAAEITYRQMKKGASGNSFPPIVVTGAKSSMPHGEPGNDEIKPGDFVTMDFGCIYEGYCSDMNRTVAIGHATDEMKNVYSIVLEAQLKGIAAARAGIAGCEIDNAAREVIAAAGYGEYFGHSFGHSLGLNIHEGPNASPTEKRIMPVGAVISAEPGIYLPGKFGVRIEDILYLEKNGCINLTKSPKNLIIL